MFFDFLKEKILCLGIFKRLKYTLQTETSQFGCGKGFVGVRNSKRGSCLFIIYRKGGQRKKTGRSKNEEKKNEKAMKNKMNEKGEK